jgi:hypothetical protein
MSTQHIETSLAKIRTIFEAAVKHIDAIKPGEKLPATTLAEMVAEEFGITGGLYPTLKFLITDYPGVDVRRGARGGIYKLAPGELPAVKTKTVVKDVDVG